MTEYYRCTYTLRTLEGSHTERLKILGCFVPFGVTARVLELVPAAYRQRQGTPLNESPAHYRALHDHLSTLAMLSGCRGTSPNFSFT